MPRLKTKAIAEFGDFQTPPALAEQVCALLTSLDVAPASIVEPTCGRGAFVFASADRWPLASSVLGFDVNEVHLASAHRHIGVRSDASRFSIECADFFDTNWPVLLAKLRKPLLVIGNPPWVTNAHLGSLGGSNLPQKSNFQNHNGLDAITGKANFDISEWMLTKLADALTNHDAVLAMLVKTAVARKLLRHCWKGGHTLAEAKMFRIDAPGHFNAAVDASLIFLKFGSSTQSTKAQVFQTLSAPQPAATLALADNVLIADSNAYEQTKHLCGGFSLRWRTGIKHDCSKVMELKSEGGWFRNGLGEIVELEPDYLFPMLKTSEVAAGGNVACNRWMIVPQRSIGDNTAEIAQRAPKTWAYLQSHRTLLAKRRSSIYRDKPNFSIFGVGDYSFSPWKVAISGMYKRLGFVIVGPCRGKAVVFDDTSNFLPCPTEASATLLLSMLNSTIAKMFYQAFIFWDSKRPITVEVLNRMNLRALADELGMLLEFEEHFGAAPDHRRKRTNSRRPSDQLTLW